MRFARTGERKDDGLDAVVEPLKVLSSDHLVICRAKADADNHDGEVACLAVRDTFSGVTMNYPGKENDAKETSIQPYCWWQARSTKALSYGQV